MREECLVEDATEEYKGFTIKIYQDQDPLNPVTDYDMLGKFICWHRHYDLCSKGEAEKFRDADSFREFVEAEHPIVLPLYLMDHSGISISTDSAPFRMCDSAGWDWGQVGYVYCSLEDVKKEYSCKVVTPTIRKKVIKLLNAEVEEFDNYLRGEVYGYVVEDAEGNHIDSCWGFSGWKYAEKEMKQQGRDAIDYEIKKQREWNRNLVRTFAD